MTGRLFQKMILAVGVATGVSGCASDFITKTPIALGDPSARRGAVPDVDQPLSDTDILTAVSTLLPPENETRTFVLCEADRETGLCGEDET
ncbi:MAG: hypothetical protein AAGH41_15080, partial [Pseudomonadota bacterium]